jgi:hypothetical protein
MSTDDSARSLGVRDPSPPDPTRHDLSRRAVLRLLGAATLSAAALATLPRGLAQGGMHGHGHGSMPMTPLSDPDAPKDTLAPHDVPWENGTCAFCGMTIATPQGAPQGAGFRERTYAQLVLAGQGGAEAVHFESIACALNWAYVHQHRDGDGATYYVTDHGGPVPERGDELLLARDAVFHWAEGMRVAMNARLVAFPDGPTRMAFAAAHPEHGRHAAYGFTTLEDLAPVPEMNLITLLARHAGLLGDGG